MSPLIVLVGDYGSGKTEVAVNLVLAWAHAGWSQLAIADLDLVNPYFRCREAREPLEAAGVRVVAPAGAQAYADLPILIPQVKGIIDDPATCAVLDVGGDVAGCRVLAALAPSFVAGEHEVWFVINKSRPFTDTPEACEKTVRRIEEASGLRITGLVSNTHLMQDTTPEMVEEGLELSEQTSELLGVPVVLVAAMETVGVGTLRQPLLVMQRTMLPPWLSQEAVAFCRGA